MSCFKGQMDEYTLIAIDRFDGKNLQCTAFFLSHCHTDHMVGLNNPAFRDYLCSRQDVFIYCSEISRILLLADEEYQFLEKFIRTLDVGGTHHICVPGNIDLKEDTMVSVTPVSAGHCPGSIMFLFEGKEGTALYTGDFRWETNQVSKISTFRDGSQSECLEATVDLISNWLGRHASCVVSLSCPAKYGHEHLLAELGRRLDTKIHVPEWKVNIYNQIPDLCGIFSKDPKECRIHACSRKMGKASCLPCGYRAPGGERLQVLKIRPSTMWFTSDKTRASAQDLIVAPASHHGLHRVCYSMHSSYSEIRDVVSFLRPEKVSPNVLPAPDNDMDKVQSRLNGFLKVPHKSRLSSPAQAQSNFEPLGLLRTKSRKSEKNVCSSSEDLVFSSQEQSPKKIKMQQKAITRNEANMKHHPGGENITPDEVSSKSLSDSSYLDSNQDKDEELSLFSDDEDGVDKQEDDGKKYKNDKLDNGETQEESFRLYISGESDAEGSDDERGNYACGEKALIKKAGVSSGTEQECKNITPAKEDQYKPENIGGCGHTDKSRKVVRDHGKHSLHINDHENHMDNDQDDIDSCDSDSEVILNSQENAPTPIAFNLSSIGLQSMKKDKEMLFTGEPLSHSEALLNDDQLEEEPEEKTEKHGILYSEKESSDHDECGFMSVGKSMKTENETDISRKSRGDIPRKRKRPLAGNSSNHDEFMRAKRAISEEKTIDDNINLFTQGETAIDCLDSASEQSASKGVTNYLSGMGNLPFKPKDTWLQTGNSSPKEFKKETMLDMTNEELSSEEDDCVIISSSCGQNPVSEHSDFNLNKSLHSSSGKGKRKEINSVKRNVSSSNSPHRTDLLFGQTSALTPIDTEKESNEGEEDSSVEFLFEDSAPVRLSQEDGWLSKESLRQEKDKQVDQKSLKKKALKLKGKQSFSSNDKNLDEGTIDLTMDCSL